MDLYFDKTASPTSYNIQEQTWDQVRLQVKSLNSELFQIIEELSPTKKLTFIKARYPYGTNILSEGVLYLPRRSGRTDPISSAQVSENIKKKLLYSSIPLGLLLNKGSEIFVQSKDRIVPLKFLQKGDLFGLFEVTKTLSGIDVYPIWCVSSGSRSIFMLPKITDKIGYHRLKKELNIPLASPRSLADHWELFVAISNHPSFINDWYSDVLYFTNEWFSASVHDSKWAVFYNYLFRDSNKQKYYSQDDTAFNIGWQAFIYAMGNKNLRPRPYLLDTVKHLVSIGAGILPAFCPAISSELVAPTRLIQKMYVDIYGLKHYLPTIMHPYNLIDRNSLIKCVYYSLSFPVLQEGLPYHKPSTDIIADLREIKLIFDTLLSAIATGKINLPKSFNLLEEIKYSFFHSGMDIFNEARTTKEMPIEDPNLLNDKEFFPDRVFCTTAPFLSGCIRISVL